MTHDWNSEIHQAIEARIRQAYSEMIPKEARESQSAVETSGEMLEK
ncbi:hypothetical protein [Aeromonas caviae]|nr:hypothetical protein [Aeromonas caviae]